MRRIASLLCLFALVSCQVFPLAAPPGLATSPPTAIASPVLAAEETVNSWQVRVHPDGLRYVGDKISFEVFTTQRVFTETQSVAITLANTPTVEIGSADFGGFGIANRRQATLTWVWDTTGLTEGDYELIFKVQPSGQSFTQTIALQAAADMPLWEAAAAWAETRTSCCIVHYLTQTEAERDLPELLDAIDAEAVKAAQRIGSAFSEPVTITLIPRLLGHGGFADDAIHVSYLDRSAVGEQTLLVIHHELIHILDKRLGGDLRPSILVEGLAVYLSGGHFKPEPLLPRAATLLENDGEPGTAGPNSYIPLEDLADAFYTSQHEIGYLQAGALVEFMVARWGWDRFNLFYRDIHPVEGQGQAAAINLALQRHFGVSLKALEDEFLAALSEQPADLFWREDVRLTVLHFDTLRRYQQLLDPSAYFLTAWLVDEKEMRERGISADYLRKPESPLNITVELLLGEAGQALQEGRHEDAAMILNQVNNVLDDTENGAATPSVSDSIVFTVFERVNWLTRQNLRPQTLSIEDEKLVFGVRMDDSTLYILRLPRKW